MDSATKTRIDAAKTASRRVVQKTIEATGDLIGNKIPDKVTSADKTKSKEKEDETNKRKRKLHTTRKKTAKNRYFKIKMEYHNITNLLDRIPGSVHRFITKNGQNFLISQVTQKIDKNQVSQQDLRYQFYNHTYEITVMDILLLKELLMLMLQIQIIMHIMKN